MLVRYFDLGTFKGGELSRMNTLLAKHPQVTAYEMYGFEAHPKLARHCRLKFLFNKRVNIVNTALGDSEGECTLYLNRNLVGSSIYAGKNNVIAGREITVPKQKLSDWLRAHQLTDAGQSFNIIKSNIEGAELEVWNDLVNEKLVSLFDLWLGPKEGYDGWAEDFKKIKGMEDKADALGESFKAHGAYVHRFSSFDKNIANSDIDGVFQAAVNKWQGKQ